MAVAAERTVGLPPGPREPKVAQAFRYSRQFPEYTAEQYARHGASWTLRLPGLPDAVITTDRELIRSVFTGDPTSRRHANDIFVTSLGPRSVMLLEPQPHLGRRRLLLPPFHGERVSVYAQLMRELVDAELNTWSGEVGVHQRARHLTVGVIQSAVLGSRDPAFEAELARLMDVFASPLANFGLFAPALQRRSRWNVLAEPFHREADKLNALMDRQIAAARADPRLAERDDVLAMLIGARDEAGHGLTDADLRDELKTLIAAGHETTATAIAWACDLLAHRPEAAAAIRDGDAAYRSAAAKEILRLRPVVPVVAGRVMLEPAACGAFELPAGTTVLVDALNTHNDPELHPEPGEFRPQRFFAEGPPPYSYLPWGGGAHRCLGRALATQELEIALEAILARFDLSPAGPPEKPVRRGVTLVPAQGATVRVRRRAGS